MKKIIATVVILLSISGFTFADGPLFQGDIAVLGGANFLPMVYSTTTPTVSPGFSKLYAVKMGTIPVGIYYKDYTGQYNLIPPPGLSSTSITAWNLTASSQAYWNAALRYELDPYFTGSEAYNITASSTSDWQGLVASSNSWNALVASSGTWNTAYGWGDHNIAGYMKPIATTTLTMGNYAINSSSNITAAYYQIGGTTVLTSTGPIDPTLGVNGNLFIGPSAGIAISTGILNVFVGPGAGYSATGASSNTFVGYGAGAFTTTGGGNTFIGDGAGLMNSTGNHNSMFGISSGENNTGSDNTFIGNDSGSKNTTGLYNTYLGSMAGRYNQTGSENTMIGEEAAYGTTGQSFSYNTAVGRQAGYRLGSNANNNAFVGYQAGYSETAADNTFVGYKAGYAATGSSNTAIGMNSSPALTSGEANTTLGQGSGLSLTTGSNNTFTGAKSGLRNQTGSYNTIVGYQAGFGVLNNSNSSNTIVGYQAGFGLTTGSQNIFLGMLSGSAVTTGTGNITLGYNITGAAADTNKLNIGNTITGTMGYATVNIAQTGVTISSATTSTASLCFVGAVDSLPTTGYSQGCISYLTTDPTKLYISTETVVGTQSWLAK